MKSVRIIEAGWSPLRILLGSSDTSFRRAAQNRAGHHLVEIATGMNYWDGQQWTSSDPTFDITDNAYVATGSTQVRLAPTSIWLVRRREDPTGTILRLTPAAIGLYDAASGRSR